MSRNESSTLAVSILLAVTLLNVFLVVLLLAPASGLAVPGPALTVIVVAEAAAVYFAYNHAKHDSRSRGASFPLAQARHSPSTW